MPLLPPEAKAAGISLGGEGSQWPRWEIAISETDPDFLLLPIDVGGLYRSLDGGRRWDLAMQGWNARGANGFAIDPRNASRVIGIGGNSLNWDNGWGPSPHGLYLSVDKAASWKHVLAVPDGLCGAVAFDPTSYDASKGFCRTAYYASSSAGLFRTDDGGQTWSAVSRQPIGMNNEPSFPPLLKVHPTRGYVYLAGQGGFFRSEDGGKTFKPLWNTNWVWGLSVPKARPDDVYISGVMGILHSTDSGRTFSALAATGIARGGAEQVRNINVSPVDPNRMLCWVAGANWRWVRYVSADGGNTFTPIKIERGLATSGADINTIAGGYAPLPYNARNGLFSWSPVNPNIVYGLGGDWVTRSADGGKTFRWCNNGYNGIMLGASFNFSPHAPNTVFLGFQDYNGAFTTDGGVTWNYRDVSGKGWGGHAYGGYAVDRRLMWYGDSDGWGAKRYLRLSRDGGNTWSFAADSHGTKIEWTGADISYSDQKNPNILFASNWRSSDHGATWTQMTGCQGVYIGASDGRLFGRDGNTLVQSRDSGATWQKVTDVPGGFTDVAYDAQRDRFYVASEDHLKQFERGALTEIATPHDQYNNVRVTTVATDPQIPAIVYAGGPRNIYASHATIERSTDAGATWENLTTGQGPHEVAAIRVNPQTREAWVNGQCFGMWRIGPPTVLGAAPTQAANAPPAQRPPMGTALFDPSEPPPAVRNGSMSDGDKMPNYWDHKWGSVTVQRDTVVYKSGPASLRVDSSGSSGQAFQLFELPGRRVFKISGWVKSHGDVKVNVAVQSFDPGWTKNKFDQVKYIQGDCDWTSFEKVVEIPEWAARFNVQLMVEGSGQAWLDDVKTSPANAAP